MNRELPPPKSWKTSCKTEVTDYGWLKPKIDRGYGKDQYTLHDLEDFIFPNIEQFRSAVQAGGGLGMWSAKMAERFEKVYTFEPNWELFHCMQQNLPQPNIYKYQAALGYERGLVDMNWGYSNNNMGGYWVQKGGNIPTLRVDDLGLKDLDLLMLDIEGAEYEALKGAEETVSLCKPTIVLEWKPHTWSRFGASEKQMREWLREHGYRFVCDFHNGRDQLWNHRSR